MPDMMPGGPPGAMPGGMPGGAPGGAPGGMPDPAALMALMKLNRKRGGGLKHRKKGKRKK